MVVKEYGYEYDAITNDSLYKSSQGKCTTEFFNGAYCVRSGRDALKYIASENIDAIALLPALSCDSMVLPFALYGINVYFYQLTESYKINIDSLFYFFNKYDDRKIIFLYMDYFGIEAISDFQLNYIKEKFKNVVFLDDITHTLFSERKRIFHPDYTVASIRKWLNIPDGGLLWSKKVISKSSFVEDRLFFETRLYAQNLRNKFLKTGDLKLKKEYRSIFSKLNDVLNSDKKPSKMSEYSFMLLQQTDFENIKSIRKQNAQVLISIFSKCSKIKLIQNDSCSSNLYVPFLIDDRDAKQSSLSKMGIFNTIIWPIDDKQKKACAVSKYIEEHMLAAPCDQRYTSRDMEFIGNEIVRIINE